MHFSKKYDRKIAKSTMSTILKNSDEILNSDTPNAYRNRKAQYPELEEALHLFYCDIRANNLPISNEIVLTKAMFFKINCN